MLRQAIIFEHVKQRSFTRIIQTQKEKFATLLP